MEDISEVMFVDCTDSAYIKPKRMHYKQAGKQKTWDFMKVHDAVAVILYNTSRHSLIFVKQFRPAVYARSLCYDDSNYSSTPCSSAVTYEMCAGIVDKDLPLIEIAREEILEECGYDIPVESLQYITAYKSGVGLTGGIQTLYYAEVADDQRVNTGGGNIAEGEYIEVVHIPIADIEKFVFDEKIARPQSFLMALMWFIHYKLPEIQSDVKFSATPCCT